MRGRARLNMRAGQRLLLELEFDDELLEELLDELEELLLDEFELELELELLLLLELEFEELLRELFEELLDELLLLRFEALRPTDLAARFMLFSQPRKKPCTGVSPRGLLRELLELEFELEFELLLEDELLAWTVAPLAASRPATVVAIMRCRVCCFMGAPVQGEGGRGTPGWPDVAFKPAPTTCRHRGVFRPAW